MNTKQIKKLWRLYDILNKMGGPADLTAVSTKALVKYKEALGTASIVIALIITKDDDKRCEQLMNELDALSRWNFGDKYGNMSEDEKAVNERIKKVMDGWKP